MIVKKKMYIYFNISKLSIQKTNTNKNQLTKLAKSIFQKAATLNKDGGTSFYKYKNVFLLFN